MDPLGLAIGIAGLVPLFSVCVQLFDIIDSGQTYGQDYEILIAKVEVERVRLFLWGESVGLSGQDVNILESDSRSGLDQRLDDRRVCSAVSDVLECMKRVFEDTDALKRRYGLQQSASAPAIQQSEGGRNALKAVFKRTYEKFHSAAKANQQNASLKSTAKWAIVDKKHFRQLIADLRDFNDSLSALFPDVEDHTQVVMTAGIRATVNTEDLRVIEQATMDGNGDLSEVASTRLSEISHREPDGPDKSEAASVASTLPRAVNIDNLAKQLDKLEVQLQAKNQGVLRVSINNYFDTKYLGHVGWDGIVQDEYFIQQDREAEFVKYPYLAWSLKFATERKEFGFADFAELDTEASRKFEGKIPATMTVHGFAAEFSEWASENIPQKPEVVFLTTQSIRNLTLKKIINRLSVLQLRKDLNWNHSDKQAWDEVKELVGPSSTIYTDPSYEYMMSSQIMSLLSLLNNPGIFNDLRDGGSLGAILNAPLGTKFYGVGSFLLQIVLAYELLVRSKRNRGWYSGITPRVTAAMQVAERWIESVKCIASESNEDIIEFHSLVHERQVEGLIRFAEALEWPYLAEMRDFVEDAYVKLRTGSKVDINLWDWIYAAVLPGTNFIFKIMSSLVTATPSLTSMGPATFFASSLALPERSYWRSRYVVGRVFGGMKGVKSVAGWVGPCPPVEDKTMNGWIRVRARSVAFKLPNQQNRFHGSEEDQFSTSSQRAQSESRAEWIQNVGDLSNWVTPEGPSGASERCQFRALRLQELADDPDLSGLYPNPVSQEYRASIEFAIDDKNVTFTLYSNPTFVAAHSCLDGPHAVYKRDLPRLHNICSIGDLKGRGHSVHGVLIINATCEDGEFVARAWCAENGQHAVVRRGTGTCFTCAVRMASNGGLGINCLIWT